MGFTKLDEGILQSSIMAEDSDTFKIWVALMAACKGNGVAPVSPVFLSSVCHLSIETVMASLEKLQAPDPMSRSLDDEGRRIRRINRGWKLINYHHYRKYLYSDSLEAIRQRRHREKECDNRDVSRMSRNGRDISASASASESSSLSLTKNIEEIKEGWNEFAAKHNLATITKIDQNSERGRHLAARMAEKDWDFPKLLEAVGESPFLIGKKGKEPFFVTFDWLLWPGNYQRTMEGNYRERKRKESFWGEGDSDKD